MHNLSPAKFQRLTQVWWTAWQSQKSQWFSWLLISGLSIRNPQVLGKCSTLCWASNLRLRTQHQEANQAMKMKIASSTVPSYSQLSLLIPLEFLSFAAPKRIVNLVTLLLQWMSPLESCIWNRRPTTCHKSRAEVLTQVETWSWNNTCPFCPTPLPRPSIEKGKTDDFACCQNKGWCRPPGKVKYVSQPSKLHHGSFPET